MERQLAVREEYLYLPIRTGQEEVKVEIFQNEEGEFEKLYEFMVPVCQKRQEEYEADFYAELPVKEFVGRRLLVRAEAPSAFLEGIQNEKKRVTDQEDRPVIHFAANAGWTNDPNGLIYADGVYHLYFQYNPFGIAWNNMSWGHAVSRDLLHWSQEDSVMFPDESGTMFSGSAIKNERKLLGLPQDAILFYYTAAGDTNAWSQGQGFTQKIAYSLDGGKTLVKKKEPCLPMLCEENRDPKVYWHEETGAYVMALFLKGNDYGIYRSKDLEHWEETDRFTLEEAWECPDFFRLTAPDGKSCWFFWTADGFYYTGEFDGYRFHTDGVRHHAYVSTIPYAAQTYTGIDGRIVMIPWLRLPNDGRSFTGAYGIPVELSCIHTQEGFLLLQTPVRELMEQARPVNDCFVQEEDALCYTQEGPKKALVFEMKAQKGYQGHFLWEIGGSRIVYAPESGKLMVDDEKYQVGCNHEKVLMIADDNILEIFFDDGIRAGTFSVKDTIPSLQVSCEGMAEYAVYEIG